MRNSVWRPTKFHSKKQPVTFHLFQSSWASRRGESCSLTAKATAKWIIGSRERFSHWTVTRDSSVLKYPWRFSVEGALSGGAAVRGWRWGAGAAPPWGAPTGRPQTTNPVRSSPSTTGCGFLCWRHGLWKSCQTGLHIPTPCSPCPIRLFLKRYRSLHYLWGRSRGRPHWTGCEDVKALGSFSQDFVVVPWKWFCHPCWFSLVPMCVRSTHGCVQGGGHTRDAKPVGAMPAPLMRCCL